MHIHRPVHYIDVVTPDLIEQFFACLHSAVVGCQIPEKFELLAGQLKLLFPATDQVAVAVHLQVVHPDHFLLLFRTFHNSSREMSESELGQARASGVEPVAIPFAVDGLAIIVHEENPVRELTLEQLGGIFAGRITNWNELGGPDREITLYGRQSNSGTYVFFRDRVVQGEYSRRMMNMNGTAQIVEAVRNDRSGAGYVGIGYIVDPQGEPISGIGVVNIASAEEEPAVSPLQRENVEQGVYPISRPLYQYVNGLEDERLIDFIRFELGCRGQQIVAGSGYYPLGGELVEENRQRGVLP